MHARASTMSKLLEKAAAGLCSYVTSFFHFHSLSQISLPQNFYIINRFSVCSERICNYVDEMISLFPEVGKVLLFISIILSLIISSLILSSSPLAAARRRRTCCR